MVKKKNQTKISSFSFSFSVRVTFCSVCPLLFFFLLCPSFLLFEKMSNKFHLILFIYKSKTKICIYAFWRKICLSLQRLSSKFQWINKQPALSNIMLPRNDARALKMQSASTSCFYNWPSLSMLSSFSDEEQLLSSQ